MAALSAPSAPYGIKAVRHIKASNTSSQGPQISSRLKKRKEKTYQYFLEKVDPILGDCITHMLVEQPDDVIFAMVQYLRIFAAKMENQTPDPDLLEPSQWPSIKPKKEMKQFLAHHIGPVVGRIVNRIAVSLPDNAVDFMLGELSSMMFEQAMCPDRVEEIKPDVSFIHKPTVETPTAEVSSTVEVVSPKPEPKHIHIAVFGVNNVGKSTILNILQGKFDPHTKPTVGFRPVPMSLSDDVTVKFFDLGGGAKIRDIWKNYYHDAHGIVYVIDAAAQEETELPEALSVLEQTLSNRFLRGKPLLVFANKQDKPGARPAAYWQDVLGIPEEYEDNLFIAECSSFIPPGHDGEFQPDPNIESGVDMLLQSVLERYTSLNNRVIADAKVKALEEAQERLERERKVLKNKIASAFADVLDADIVAELNVEADPKNVFSQEEGEAFLAAEISEEHLPPIGQEVAAMIGYQRLAMQIVGALKSPISKKKVAMSWEEIHQLVSTLRAELRLK